MNNIFTVIWTVLTTTNENLINILSIPCNFLEIAIFMLLSTTILKINTSKKQKIIYVLLFSLITIISNYIIPNPYKVILNLILSPILVFFIFRTTVLNSILSEIFPLVFGAILETTFLKLYLILFGISDSVAYTVPIHRFALISINYLTFFLIYKICKLKNINITILDNMDKKTKILLLINSIFMIISFALQTFLVSFYVEHLPIYVTVILLIILLGYYIISLYSLIKTTKLQLTEQDLEQSKQYNKTLTILYDNIRCFKHDYNNMLTTLGGYILSEDIKGLKKYYNELLQDCSKVKNLSTLSPEVINNPAIYSLLTNKYYQASELGIHMNIETFIDFEKINMKMYEFTKVLGILLDNAIEAAKECSEKTINIIISNDFKINRQLVIVENTYNDKNIDTEKIYEKGFTSKQDNTGLGLWETRQILKKNNNLNLFTSKNNKLFKQQLEIYC